MGGVNCNPPAYGCTGYDDDDGDGNFKYPNMPWPGMAKCRPLTWESVDGNLDPCNPEAGVGYPCGQIPDGKNGFGALKAEDITKVTIGIPGTSLNAPVAWTEQKCTLPKCNYTPS